MTKVRRSHDARRVRLFVRCLRWGIATGAVTGAVIGGAMGFGAGLGRSKSLLVLTPAGVFYGTIIGTLVSVIPSLLGSMAVTGLLPRHPSPSSEVAIQRDLRSIFRSVIALLDAALLAVIIATGAHLMSVAYSVPFILAGNICVVFMLRRASQSIGRVFVAPTG